MAKEKTIDFVDEKSRTIDGHRLQGKKKQTERLTIAGHKSRDKKQLYHGINRERQVKVLPKTIKRPIWHLLSDDVDDATT